MKYLFTACFLLWEGYQRVRGRWRRWVRSRQRGED